MNIEALAREAAIFQFEDGSFRSGGLNGIAQPDLARFAALIRAQAWKDAAQHITGTSTDTYGVLLREHGEAADWLRALKDKP